MSSATCIYLDYNATTPLDEEVSRVMMPYLQGKFGNPSSSHCFGKPMMRDVDEARQLAADALCCKPQEITFTSGGTESVNWAIKGAAEGRSGGHIITTAIEHVVVLECCSYLESKGFRVTRLGVDSTGRVSVDAVLSALESDTFLITIMHANNETGSLQPIEDIAKAVKGRAPNVLVHSDCSQSIGKADLDLSKVPLDLATVAGHKLYAPAGIGALFMREGVTIAKFMHGAGHEHGRRAGTENVIYMIALGKAMEIAKRDLHKNMEHMKKMRDLLYFELHKVFGDELVLNGHTDERLSNTLNVSFPNVLALHVVHKLGDTVAFSAGSACHAGVPHVSHVLSAMGVAKEPALAACRFSVGRHTTEKEILDAVPLIVQAVKQLQAQQQQK